MSRLWNMTVNQLATEEGLRLFHIWDGWFSSKFNAVTVMVNCIAVLQFLTDDFLLVILVSSISWPMYMLNTRPVLILVLKFEEDLIIPFLLNYLCFGTISNMAIYWPRIFHDEILSIILPRKYLYCSTKICIWRINIGILMSVSQCQHITVKYLSYLSKISTFLKSSLSKKN